MGKGEGEILTLTLGCGTGGGSSSSGLASLAASSSSRSSRSSSSGSPSTGTHEVGNRLGGINGTAAVRATKSRRLATHLAGADDGGISLGAATRRGTITRSTIRNCSVVRLSSQA